MVRGLDRMFGSGFRKWHNIVHDKKYQMQFAGRVIYRCAFKAISIFLSPLLQVLRAALVDR
jgi:hypothetical protein